jgi:peroxiredoxin-like protein
MNKPHLFTVDLSWIADDRGLVSAPAVKHSISVTKPPEFGGPEGEWNPELLFLSAVTSCYMTTYLLFVKKINFENAGFECTATGQAEVVDGKYKFTYIHIYPKAYVTNEADMEKAVMAMEKTKKYCLISNSINAEIIQHPEVAIAKPDEMTSPLKKSA